MHKELLSVTWTNVASLHLNVTSSTIIWMNSCKVSRFVEEKCKDKLTFLCVIIFLVAWDYNVFFQDAIFNLNFLFFLIL